MERPWKIQVQRGWIGRFISWRVSLLRSIFVRLFISLLLRASFHRFPFFPLSPLWENHSPLLPAIAFLSWHPKLSLFYPVRCWTWLKTFLPLFWLGTLNDCRVSTDIFSVGTLQSVWKSIPINVMKCEHCWRSQSRHFAARVILILVPIRFQFFKNSDRVVLPSATIDWYFHLAFRCSYVKFNRCWIPFGLHSEIFLNLIVIFFRSFFGGCCRCGFCVAGQPKTSTFLRPWHSFVIYYISGVLFTREINYTSIMCPIFFVLSTSNRWQTQFSENPPFLCLFLPVTNICSEKQIDDRWWVAYLFSLSLSFVLL